MTSYFPQAVLLIIPTFLGITMAVFVIMHFVPGGPVERQIMRMRMAAMTEGGARQEAAAASTLNCRKMPSKQIRQYYGFDKPVHIRYALWLWNVLHLNLGNSYIYQDPVWDVIKSRFPISLTLGLTGFLLSYLVCIPLGVLKAVRHGTKFDMISSVIVFLGYSVPGWALGTALLVLFGGGSFWNVFPLGGFRPDNWNYLDFGQKVYQQARYMFLPVLCYMVGEFATLTILTKNALMENMAQDYIRTAYAKGPAQAARHLRARATEFADSAGDRHRQRVQPDSGRIVPDRERSSTSTGWAISATPRFFSATTPWRSASWSSAAS